MRRLLIEERGDEEKEISPSLERILAQFERASPELQALVLLRAALRAHYLNLEDEFCFLAGSRAALSLLVNLKMGAPSLRDAVSRAAAFASRSNAYRLSLASKALDGDGQDALREVRDDWPWEWGQAQRFSADLIDPEGLGCDLEAGSPRAVLELGVMDRTDKGQLFGDGRDLLLETWTQALRKRKGKRGLIRSPSGSNGTAV